ncbi:hypothetical protein AOQ84DRAFT_371518, partial [Glonium stellatum]
AGVGGVGGAGTAGLDGAGTAGGAGLVGVVNPNLRVEPAPDPPIHPIELEGIRRAVSRALSSNLAIVVVDATTATLDPEVVSTTRQCIAQGIAVVVAVNKTDRLHPHTRPAVYRAWTARVNAELGVPAHRVFFISCREAAAADGDVGQTAAVTAASTATTTNATANSATATATAVTGRDANTDADTGTDTDTGTGAGTETDARTAATPDPGGIQAFLRGLIATFEDMTAALVPDLSGAADNDRHPPLDPSVWQESLGASERQRVLLDECIGHLDAFLSCVESGGGGDISNDDGEVDIVVAAEALRAAAGCMARVTGRGDAGDVEEVLGAVFEK